MKEKNIENGKKEKAEKKEKKSRKLFQHSNEKPLTFKEFLSASLYAVIGIPICILAAYISCLFFIGNGAYAYSNTVYESIESSIYHYVQADMGIDYLALQKEVNRIKIDSKNGETKLTCIIQNGYFRAKVTAILSDNATILKTSRNYNSLEHYMLVYRIVSGVWMIGGGFALWFVATWILCTIRTKKFQSLTKKQAENAILSTTVSTTNSI